MRFLTSAVLVLSCGICLAEDAPDVNKNNSSLSAEKAAEMISEANGADRYYLNLSLIHI